MLIDTTGKKTKEIKFNSNGIYKDGYPQIIATDTFNRKTFWLIGEAWDGSIIRVWEDGNVETLGTSRALPFYIDKKLFADTKPFTQIYQLNESGMKLLKEINRISFSYSNTFISPNSNISRIYALQDGKIIGIDLKTLQITEIGTGTDDIIWATPQETYCIESKVMSKKIFVHNIYRIEKDKMIFLKQIQATEFFQKSRNGFITKQDGKLSVYAFPDLRELHF